MKSKSKNEKIQEYTVKGMHCPACEIFIEKKLLQCSGIQSAKVSYKEGKVSIQGDEQSIQKEQINALFENDSYYFTEFLEENQKSKTSQFILSLGVAVLVVIGFYLIERTGFTRFVTVESTSSLIAFFAFGIIAGVSSCAALVGGLVLSLAKQWNELYFHEPTFLKKMQPHFLFNIGRLLAFAGGGGMFGFIGKQLSLSLHFSSILVIGVSVIMIILGLQMLGVKFSQSIRLGLPGFLTGYFTNEKNFQGRLMPLVMGAFTFFLPCGFTLTVQSIALLSGSSIHGSLILFLFALGTLFPLLGIGFSSLHFLQKPRISAAFLKTAGIVVIFFALFNFNSQLNLLGLHSLSDLTFHFSPIADQSLHNEALVNNIQIIKMEASARGYSPNTFTVKRGIPVRWEIVDVGTSGCTNAVIAKDFFEGRVELSHGMTSVKEFVPEVPGKYKFSCWMGMITGVIEVVN
jgi:sulfite exporter TauE/SafE/copper chaperone CopZ/plastocyanin